MPKKSAKVAAIVVTYNRPDLLELCLDSLLEQTCLPDLIIVFDNSTTPDTKELFSKKYLRNSRFVYLNMGQNLGGAGGFHYGVKYAFEHDFEYFCLLDDDVKLSPNAIELFLKNAHQYDFIQAHKYDYDMNEFPWLGKINILNGISSPILNKYFRSNFVATACFEGCFFNRRVVETIGFPEKRFFIVLDDGSYGALASYFNFRRVYLDEYLIQKTRKVDSRSISTVFAYYAMRNIFLMEKIIKQKTDLKVNYMPGAFLIFITVFIKILLFNQQKFSLFKALFSGLKAGFKIRTEEPVK